LALQEITVVFFVCALINHLLYLKFLGSRTPVAAADGGQNNFKKHVEQVESHYNNGYLLHTPDLGEVLVLLAFILEHSFRVDEYIDHPARHQKEERV
jgi:hypothetical protein